MWTFVVAVAIGGRGVDANLRIFFQQVLKGAWRIVGRVALPNCARKRRSVVQFPWELAEDSLKNLASTSLVAKLISQEIDGQIPCRLLLASTRSREADSVQVRYRFNGLSRGIPPQLVSEQEISGIADIRDWGGGGDDPEESTQCLVGDTLLEETVESDSERGE
ncbi:hypothetical protein Taro_000386 [Colocasia esculenta]|uniref:Uncharacterized protein n=1 Tax=Colocasia esculenta TaxID=4460 RepID=A0A843TGI5_COLES|nr:hypothetical protein [Colocasia esculenta]